MSSKQVRADGRQAVADENMDSGWVDRELAEGVFGDERLGKRFRSLLEQLSSSPGGSIPLACQDWANTKAAYRFLDNDRVNEAEILGGHFESTRVMRHRGAIERTWDGTSKLTPPSYVSRPMAPATHAFDSETRAGN